MANIKEVKQRTLATIDAALSILNRYPDLENANIELSYDTSTNPFNLLMDLLKSTSGYNKIISVLGKFIAWELPVVENTVKALLIAKLKDIISCSVNPFFTEEILREGVVFNVEEIDIADILKYSPFDKRVGKYFYFDTEEAEKPEDLTTCDDMNAFIWFMINKSNKRYVWKPKKNRHDNEFRPDYPHQENAVPTEEDIDEHYNIPLENLNEAHDSGEMTDEEYEQQKEILDKKYEKYVKNYNKLKKEDGIITIEYHERSQNLKDAYGNDHRLQTPYNNCLHVFIGDVREKEEEIYEKEEDIKLFANKIENKQFKIDSLQEEKENLEVLFEQEVIDEKEFKKEYKKINNKITKLQKEIEILNNLREKAYAAKRRLQYEIGEIKKELEITRDQFFPFLNGSKNRNYYYGKTLIEWNIDYISSLTLFEAKSLTAQLLDSLTSVITVDLHLTYKQQLIKNEVKKMVRMITESDDLVISDCFFTFTNDDYDAMSRQAELKKAGLLTINGDETSAVKINAEKLLDKLNNISQNASKETIQTTINDTIIDLTKELSDVTYEMTENVNFGVQMNIIENLLNSLAYVLVTSILSPKIYLLLLVNLKIIGRQTNFDLEGFIDQYRQLIADLIRLIRDQLIEYLMNEIMIIIGDLVKEITFKLSIEQARYYARLIKKLIDCFREHGREMDFNIDDVDYADIIDTEEEPKNNDC